MLICIEVYVFMLVCEVLRVIKVKEKDEELKEEEEVKASDICKVTIPSAHFEVDTEIIPVQYIVVL